MITNETIRKVVINKALFPGGGSQEVVKSAESSGVNQTIQFTTNLRKPFQSVNYTIVPAQEGTGDPSPSNPRAIIGYTKVNMLLSAPGISKRNIVTFPGTLYGGVGDESGSFTNKYGIVDLGSLTWTYRTDVIGVPCFLSSNISDIKSGSIPIVCSCLEIKTPNRTAIDGNYQVAIGNNTNAQYLVIRYDEYTDGAAVQEALTGQKLLYELATPTTLTVDPITFETFTSTQTARFEEKFPFTIEYLVSESEPANYAQQFLPIFYPNGSNQERRFIT